MAAELGVPLQRPRKDEPLKPLPEDQVCWVCGGRASGSYVVKLMAAAAEGARERTQSSREKVREDCVCGSARSRESERERP